MPDGAEDDHGLVITGMHEPQSLPHAEIPEADWTSYQKWFSTIPTVPAISCTPRDHRSMMIPS